MHCFKFRALHLFLGYCSFFPFPLLETIKSLVRTKEKSFFEHSSPKKASGVSSEKRTTIFPRDKMAVETQTMAQVQPAQTDSCEICNGPHQTVYCFATPQQI